MAETYTDRTLREMVRVVAGRFLGMLTIFVVVVAGVGLASYFAPKWYRSTAKLIAKPTRTVSPLETQVPMRDEVSLFVTTQREIIMSDYVLASALLALEGQRVPKPLPAEDEEIKQWDEKVRLYIAGDAEKGIPGHGQYIRKIRKRIKVVTPGGPDATFTQTFTIHVDWPSERSEAAKAAADPQKQAAGRARKLNEHVIGSYLMRYTVLESRRTRDAAKFLREKSLAAVEANLENAFNARRKFVDEQLKGDLLHVINMVGSQGGGVETGIASLHTEIQSQINAIDARVKELEELKNVIDREANLQKLQELDELLAGIDEAENQRKIDLLTIIVPGVVSATNPSVKELQMKFIALNLRLNSLAPRYTNDYQEIINTRKEFCGVMRSLLQELINQGRKLTDEKSVLQARGVVLNQKLAETGNRMEALASKAAEYERLQNTVMAAQELYDSEQKRTVDAATARMLAENPVLVSLLDEPSQPDPADPRRPILWLNVLIAVVGGFILALVYAFLADHFDHSIKSIDDAERYLGVPVLSSVPKLGWRIIRTR